jgi:hypothetical protein
MNRYKSYHLIGRLEASVGDFSHAQLLMISLLSGDDRCIGSEREMNPRVWHQVGLELSQVNVQSTVESERSCDGADDLADKSIQVGVRWSFDVKISVHKNTFQLTTYNNNPIHIPHKLS